MEKIFQILIVFVLMMLMITRFIRAREPRFHEYFFSGRFTFPLSAEMQRDLLTTVVAPAAMFPAVDGSIQMEAGREVYGMSGSSDEDSLRVGDELSHLLFRRGEGKTLEIVDTVNAVVTGTVSLEWEADAIVFDPLTRLIYCGSAEGAVTIIRQSPSGAYKVVQRLAVPKDCTALSLDPHTGKLYVHVGASVFVYANA